jgi:DNA polymerase III sliding clamp (beta) subunit (PCNA family)
MQITLNRKELVRALAPLALLTKDAPEPLRQVRISAYASAAFLKYEASFRVYNGAQELTVSVPTTDAVVPATAAPIALDVKELFKFARSASESPLVTIRGDGTVVSGALIVKLPTFPLADLPELPFAASKAGARSATIDLEAIRRVAHAMSQDYVREDLHGVCVECDADGVVHTVATDGHRLAVVRATAPTSPYHLLIPYDAVLAILSAPATEAHASWNDDYLSLHTATYHLITRLSDAKFPPWRKVVPAAYDRAPILLPRKALVAVLKSMSKAKRGAIFSASGDGNTIIVCEELGVTGSVVAPWTGEAVGVNPRYLREAIEDLVGDTVTLELSGDALDPLAVREGNYTAVVMQVRI